MGNRNLCFKAIKPKAWSLVLLLFIFLPLLMGCRGGNSTKNIIKAPDFKVSVFNEVKGWEGKQLVLSSLQGKPVAIHFSASWCAACEDIFNSLDPFRKQGLFVVGVGVLDKEAQFKKMIMGMNLSIPVAFDSDRIAKKYQVYTLPLTVFITKEGTVFQRVYGTLKQNQIQEIVKRLI